MALWENPEFIRNWRAQMRPARVIGAVLIVLLLSWFVGYSLHATAAANPDWAKTLVGLALGVLLAVLGLGGGIACGLSIYRERERNTFDFQRVTRLTPMELTLGKLFGAPIFFHLLALCLLPGAIVGAVAAGLPALILLAGIAMIVVGCVTFHALGLLVSLASPRGGSGLPGALLILLLMGLIPPMNSAPGMRSMGPWMGVKFAVDGSWETKTLHATGTYVPVSEWTDLVFGRPVHSVPVMLILYSAFLAWLLLALARNMKRDSGDLELYSPEQSVGLVCFINVVVLAFYAPQAWHMAGASAATKLTEAFQIFSVLNLVLLYFLGFTLLRNRDQSRRRVYVLGVRGPGWQEALWPSGYVVAAGGIVALIVGTRLAFTAGLEGGLDRNLAAFQIAFLVVTIVRDLLYFQWMKLRRARYPQAMAALFLGVFVVCSTLLLNTLGFFEGGKEAIVAMVPLPWLVLALDSASWAGHQASWAIPLAVQLVLCVLFAWLHFRKLAELAPHHGVERNATPTIAASRI